MARYGLYKWLYLYKPITVLKLWRYPARRTVDCSGDGDGLLSVGASLGFAFFPAHGGDTEVLKKSADNAMYDAKRNHLGWRVSGSPQPSSAGD